MKGILSLNRLFLQLKRDFIEYKKMMLWLYGGVFGLYVGGFLLLSLLGREYTLAYSHFLDMYVPLMYLVIIIWASSAFREFREEGSAIGYLTLPTTELEKFLSMWILSFWFNLLVMILVAYLVYYTLFLFSFLWGGNVEVVSIEIAKVLISQFKEYLIIHSAFFMGSIFFSKNSFWKTILGFYLILTVYTVLLGLITFIYYKTTGELINLFSSINYFLHKTWFIYLTSFVFLIVGYLRLTEKQV